MHLTLKKNSFDFKKNPWNWRVRAFKLHVNKGLNLKQKLSKNKNFPNIYQLLLEKDKFMGFQDIVTLLLIFFSSVRTELLPKEFGLCYFPIFHM